MELLGFFYEGAIMIYRGSQGFGVQGFRTSGFMLR